MKSYQWNEVDSDSHVKLNTETKELEVLMEKTTLLQRLESPNLRRLDDIFIDVSRGLALVMKELESKRKR